MSTQKTLLGFSKGLVLSSLFVACTAQAGPSADEVRRMTLQNYIDNQAPLAGTTWIGTHNAYAASSDGYNPANQAAPMRAQLSAGYRVLALDLSGANGTIRLCHKVCIDGQQRPLENGLLEINDWLKQNPDEVIMLVIEDNIDHDWQREFAGNIFKTGPLAGKIYSPELHTGNSNGTCQSLPMNSITKADILAQGKQVIVTSYQGCSANGTEWRRQAWDIPSNSNLTSTYDFTKYSNLRFSDKLSIIAEDGSFWGKNAEIISGEEKDLNHFAIADALYRGVGMIGLDFAVVNARHGASIWSWAPNFPLDSHDCAVSDFRRSHYSRGDMWLSSNCSSYTRPIACVAAGNIGRQTNWAIGPAGKFADGHSNCASIGKIFRAPVNANENAALTTVKHNAGVQEVILNYKKYGNSDSSWAPSIAPVESHVESGTASGVDEQFDSISFSKSFNTTPAIFTNMQTSVGMDTADLRIDLADSAGFSVAIQEEQSQDTEVDHLEETVGYLALSPGVIKNQTGTVIGESGLLNVTQGHSDQWFSFSQHLGSYTNPVVIMIINSYNGDHAAHMRVRAVSASSFEYQLEEWEYLDGNHLTESVAYLIVESGNHTLENGQTLQAFTAVADEQLKTITYPNSFSTAPIVFSQTQTTNGNIAVNTRHKNINNSTMQVFLQEEEAQDNIHSDESVGFVVLGNN